MKKIGLIILAAFFTFAATAQTDIKVFDKIGPDAVLNKLCELNFFQEPEYFSSLHWTKSENGLTLENEKGGVLIKGTEGSEAGRPPVSKCIL